MLPGREPHKSSPSLYWQSVLFITERDNNNLAKGEFNFGNNQVETPATMLFYRHNLKNSGFK